MARVALSSSEQLQNTSTPLLHVFETRKTGNGTRGERERGGGEEGGEERIGKGRRGEGRRPRRALTRLVICQIRHGDSERSCINRTPNPHMSDECRCQNLFHICGNHLEIL